MQTMYSIYGSVLESVQQMQTMYSIYGSSVLVLNIQSEKKVPS